MDTLAVPDAINPSYYIFNYVGGGFVIVPADKRVEPIMAYSDRGYFIKSGKLPSGLISWLSLNHKNMQLLRKNSTLKAPVQVTKHWSEFQLTYDNGNPGSPRILQLLPTPPPCQDETYITLVGPLLQTQWGQGYPYNALCPAGSYSNYHTPTGCVATAMAQVMYYWQYPSSYNWSIMPLDYTNNGTTELARLINDIGVSLDMVYDDSGSHPDGVSAAQSFVNIFHYSSSNEADYDYQATINNLESHEPVILYASTDNHTFLWWDWYNDGHAWVCDGFEQVDWTTCATVDQPAMGGESLIMHMNWGWNDYWVANNSNGWYGYTDWSVWNGPELEFYQYNYEMTNNIHP